MNLWAKSLGQLLFVAVALFFFSCEDENTIIGYKNPNSKFNVRVVDIPLSSAVIPLDSLVTDNAVSADGTVLAGAYDDVITGKVVTQPFWELYPLLSSTLNSTSQYDSAVLYLRLNLYAYGFTGEQSFEFAVHQLQDTLSYVGGKRFYTNSSVPYVSAPLGFVKGTFKYDSLQANQGRVAPDTFQLAGRLDDSFGLQLFDVAKNNINNTLTEFPKFKDYFKGLTLINTSKKGVIGLNLASTVSRVALYYHTLDDAGNVKDKLVRNFVFDYSSVLSNTAFTNIAIDRSGTELAGAMPYTALDPGYRYVQSGSPVLTKIDLSNFYAFADTLDDILINSAEFVIEGVQSSDGHKPHSSFLFRVMNEQNRFVRRTNDQDSLAMRNYYLYADGLNYNVYHDTPSTQLPVATVGYKSDGARYSGYMTLFAQTLFKNKDVPSIANSRIRYLGVFPFAPTMSKSVSRTVFDKNKIKLRIHYTKPTQLNP